MHMTQPIVAQTQAHQIIEVEGIHKTYGRVVTALQDINLSENASELSATTPVAYRRTIGT